MMQKHSSRMEAMRAGVWQWVRVCVTCVMMTHSLGGCICTICVCLVSFIPLLWAAALAFPCDSFPTSQSWLSGTVSPALLGINVMSDCVLLLLRITALTAVGLETTLEVSQNPRQLHCHFCTCSVAAEDGKSSDDLNLNAYDKGFRNTLQQWINWRWLLDERWNVFKNQKKKEVQLPSTKALSITVSRKLFQVNKTRSLSK